MRGGMREVRGALVLGLVAACVAVTGAQGPVPTTARTMAITIDDLPKSNGFEWSK